MILGDLGAFSINSSCFWHLERELIGASAWPQQGQVALLDITLNPCIYDPYKAIKTMRHISFYGCMDHVRVMHLSSVLKLRASSACFAEDSFHMSYSLNSLKGGYIGDNIGHYYRGY